MTVYFPKEIVLKSSLNSSYYLALALKAKEENVDVTIVWEERSFRLLDMTSVAEIATREIGNIEYLKIERLKDVNYSVLGFTHYTDKGFHTEVLRNALGETPEEDIIYRAFKYAYDENKSGMMSIAWEKDSTTDFNTIMALTERSELNSNFRGLIKKYEQFTLSMESSEGESQSFHISHDLPNYAEMREYAQEMLEKGLPVTLQYEPTPISGNRAILFLKGTQYPIVPSPNWDSREGAPIDTLVLHYTAGSYASTESWFLSRKAQASSHYVVDLDGTIYAYVKEHYRSWHAGTSYWAGTKTLNNNSIGIEIVNLGIAGDGQSQPAYPPEQIESILNLCGEICERHKIIPHMVVGHSDIAPQRKTDPGISFPWQEFAGRGFSFYPSEEEIERQEIPEGFDMIQALSEYGFDISGTTPEGVNKALITYKLHYFVDEWKAKTWTVNDRNKKMLLALLEKLRS